MRRVLCVWLPTFSTDLVMRRLLRDGPRGDRRRAVILTRAVAGRELVARRCARAARAGVFTGMDLAHARSLLPPGRAPVIEAHRPERDAAGLHRLACWALRFSPLAAPDEPDGLVIDISGTERLHRGEGRILLAAVRGLGRLGLAARAATASTPGCAWAVSRFGAHAVSRVPTGRERDAIAGLPVAALRVGEEDVRGFREIGITRAGEVLALPRGGVVSRFGEGVARRVRQALGEEQEHVEPVRPVPPVRSELHFDGATERWESVEAGVEAVVAELARELERRERGVRRLDVEFLRAIGGPTRVVITLSRPSASAKHLRMLARSGLERVDLGEGVAGIAMTAVRTAPLRYEQGSSAGLGGARGAAHERAWGELIDALAARLGPEGVVRVEAVESHAPERAYGERSALVGAERGGARVTRADRPTRLLACPERAEAMAVTPDGPVLALWWRGRRWRVLACSGPERIGPEWWRWEPGRAPCERDYFAVQVEGGRWLWVWRGTGAREWSVHGMWG